MVTRKDVAAKAGVSPAVVSYVINNSNYVSASKRARVLGAIKELNYHPNFIAKSLKTRQSNHIAIIGDDLHNEYFNELLYEFEKIAYERGYYISMFSNRPESLKLLINYKVDGVFLFTTRYSAEQINTLAKCGIATVLCATIEYPNLDPSVNRIFLDLRGSMKQMTEYLVGKGHRRIVYLSVAPLQNGAGKSNYRYQGFTAALRKHGIRLDEDLTLHFDTDMNWGIMKLEQIISRKRRPTAIIAGNDSIALRIMGYLQHRGNEIPDEFAVVGAGNMQLGSYHHPTLTTFDYNNEALARIAIANMISMNNGIRVEDARLEVKVILRESA